MIDGTKSGLTVEPEPQEGALTTVYLAVTSQDGAESVFTVLGPGGEKLPLVALGDAALVVLRDYSQILANRTGRTVNIVSFSGRADLDSISP